MINNVSGHQAAWARALSLSLGELEGRIAKRRDREEKAYFLSTTFFMPDRLLLLDER